MSATTADIIFGGGVTLEAGELAGIDRRTDHLIGSSLGDFTRPELLAEVDRTMRALESYPAVPTLPAADLTLPAFADMWEGA
jgi:hypothetical protein